jgi:hypothetical protein
MVAHGPVEHARTLGVHLVPTTGFSTQDGVLTTGIPESAEGVAEVLHAAARARDKNAAATAKRGGTEELREVMGATD